MAILLVGIYIEVCVCLSACLFKPDSIKFSCDHEDLAFVCFGLVCAKCRGDKITQQH